MTGQRTIRGRLPGLSGGHVVVDRVSVEFGGIRALNNLSVELRSGEMVGFIGPNGSGKSTLFNCITGLVSPVAGEIRIDDESTVGKSLESITYLGVGRTFQDGGAFASLTAFEHVAVAAERKRKRESRVRTHALRSIVMDALSVVGLDSKWNHVVGNLSYGQQKLVCVASAIVRRPALLLLDEPFSGVNEIIIDSIIDLLRNQHGEWWSTVAIVEHNVGALSRLCSERIVAMSEGAIVADGPASHVLQSEEVVEAYVGRVHEN